MNSRRFTAPYLPCFRSKHSTASTPGDGRIGVAVPSSPAQSRWKRAAQTNTELKDIVNRAKGLDAEGKTKECMELVASGRLRLQ